MENNTNQEVSLSVPTLVSRVDPKKPLWPFSGGTRPLTGGIQFRRQPDENNRPKFGTLGYIATKVDGDTPVLLSCEHVLLFRRADEKLVFQPDYSKCSGIYYNEVGEVVEGSIGNMPVTGESDLFFIDAAIASVDSDISVRRFIPQVGNITGSRSIINAPTAPTIAVKKMGAATDYTEGTVESLSSSFGRAMNLITIQPVAGQTFTYKERRKVDPSIVSDVLTDFPAQAFDGTATLVDAAENIVEFESEVFALPGDSGAQLVDSAGAIVGMIVGGDMFEVRAFDEDAGRWRIAGVPKGPAFASHIQPVLEDLGLRIDPSTGTTSGRQMVVPGSLISSEDPDRYTKLSEKLAQLETEFKSTEQGRQIVHLIRSFFRETVELVHHRRPVKVAWHRHNGPAFMASFFRCISEPDRPFPEEIDGVSAMTLLERMDRVLSENCSTALYRALEQHGQVLYEFIRSSRTVNDLLFNLRERYSPA